MVNALCGSCGGGGSNVGGFAACPVCMGSGYSKDPGPAPGSGALPAIVATLFVAPVVFLASSVVVLGEWLTHNGAGYRSFLEAVFPAGWVATAPDGTNNAAGVGGIVGAFVIIAVVATSMARRSAQRRWSTQATSGRSILFLRMLLFSAMRTVLVVVGIVSVLGALGIATAADLETGKSEPLVGAGRWWAAAAGVALWSVLFAVRAFRRLPPRADVAANNRAL